MVASLLDFLDGLVKGCDFFVLQRSVGSLGHIGQLERADGSATQHHYFVSEASENAADFAILTFAQRDIDFGATLAHFADGGAIDTRDPFGKIDASLKPSHGLLFDLTSYHYEVGLGYAMFRMSQSLCELSVVGEQDQAGARCVQSAHGKQTRLGWNQIDHTWASLGIAVGAEDARWFVDGIINGAMSFQGFAVYQNLCLVGIDFDPDLRDDFPVDFNAAFGDQFVDLPTRPEPRCCEEFVDALLSAEKRRGCIGSSFWL
ncbi:hypothetical protein VN12_12975 [Pirellula sp. SH-Sr6A]|nr:hypothetical protein VN12_12975 [Pirellula sp. SH-Sr6A]